MLEEKIGKDNFILVKVENVWIPKQVYIWNFTHPDDQTEWKKDCVIFLDGNKRNFNTENLLKVTRGELCQLNRWYTITGNPEDTLNYIQVIRLKHRRVEIARKYGLADSRGNVRQDVKENQRRWFDNNPEKKKEASKRVSDWRREKMKDPVWRAEYNRKRREKRKQKI